MRTRIHLTRERNSRTTGRSGAGQGQVQRASTLASNSNSWRIRPSTACIRMLLTSATGRPHHRIAGAANARRASIRIGADVRSGHRGGAGFLAAVWGRGWGLPVAGAGFPGGRRWEPDAMLHGRPAGWEPWPAIAGDTAPGAVIPGWATWVVTPESAPWAPIRTRAACRWEAMAVDSEAAHRWVVASAEASAAGLWAEWAASMAVAWEAADTEAA